MKIKIIKEKEGEVHVVMEEMPETTFVTGLAGIKSKEDFIEKLIENINKGWKKDEKFKELELDSLEGEEING